MINLQALIDDAMQKVMADAVAAEAARQAVVIRAKDAEIATLKARIAELEASTAPAPAPAPEPTPTPTPAPEPAPAPTGFPDASTTGYRGTLTNYGGPYTISSHGVVIENKRITRSLRITGNNVVVRNCLIDYSGSWGIDAEGARGLVVERTTFKGRGGNSAILTGSDARIEGCDISGMENGITCMGGAHVIRGNYIHDLNNPNGEPHYDGISIQGGQDGTLVEGNRIESWDTSCVFIKPNFGAIRNTTVKGNLLINTPGKHTAYSVYSTIDPPSGRVPTGTRFIDNVIEKGYYGYASLEGSVEWSGNTDYKTGKPINP